MLNPMRAITSMTSEVVHGDGEDRAAGRGQKLRVERQGGVRRLDDGCEVPLCPRRRVA